MEVMIIITIGNIYDINMNLPNFKRTENIGSVQY